MTSNLSPSGLLVSLTRPIVSGTTGLLDEDVRGRHAEPTEGVELQVELLVLGTDPRIEHNLGHVVSSPYCWHRPAAPHTPRHMAPSTAPCRDGPIMAPA